METKDLFNKLNKHLKQISQTHFISSLGQKVRRGVIMKEKARGEKNCRKRKVKCRWSKKDKGGKRDKKQKSQ